MARLFEILEQVMPTSDLVLANPFKTQIIAEAQGKTEKIDARILAQLQLPEPANLLLQQQLTMLKTLQERIKEDELALAEMMRQTPALSYVQSLPGIGAILAAVVVNEVDDIARFVSAQKFSGYAGLYPSTSSSGGKTYQGKLLKHCNKWLRRAFDSLRSLSGQPLVV